MGMKKGVRGRADSLNFFEVIPSSLRENHLKNKFFFLSLPTHTCEVVCVGGASTGAMLGCCSIFSGQEVTFRARGVGWKPLENESGKDGGLDL